EQETARPMAVIETSQRDHLFAFARCQSGRIVRIALHRVRFGDVEIVLPQCQSIWAVQPLQQRMASSGFTVRKCINDALAGSSTATPDRGGVSAHSAIGQQNLTMIALQEKSWYSKTLRPYGHRKAGRNVETRLRRPGYDFRMIVRRRGAEWRRQLFVHHCPDH